MQPKLIRTKHGQYEPAPWNGVNESGITPFGDRVLILPDPFAPTTIGGIIFTDEQRERADMAAETGVLVAMGDDAWLWNSDRARKFEGNKPKVGQRVIFEQYAGSYQFGADGVRYRLMDDKCVGGLFEEGKAPTGAKKPKVAAPLARVTRPPLLVRA